MSLESDPQKLRVYRAPARVNLIGEHTDYTGGLVLPMAIPFYSRATIRPNRSDNYSFVSKLFGAERTIARGEQSSPVKDWSDYAVGVFYELIERGLKLPPFQLQLDGDIPMGAGLSSSASVEVVTAVALLRYAQVDMTIEEIARLCQHAENFYVGSPCGIMDQFAVAGGAAGHALLLNTGDLTRELLPINSGKLARTRVVIVNSMVKHSILAGEYGMRRQELESGQEILKARYPRLRHLGDAEIEQLNEMRREMSINSYRRCRYVISENGRVRDARTAMKTGDSVQLGKAMSASHVSQRDDFECSCEEIDFLVERACELPGCFGARLTGGGFGGCTVNLVAMDAVEAFVEEIQSAYLDRYERSASCYVCEAVDGAIFANQEESA